MNSPAHSTPHQDPDAETARPTIEEIEDAASFIGLAAAWALRAVEVCVVVLLGLLVCPPLLILTFLVIAPLVAAAVVISLVAAVLATPYALVRHLRGHRVPHASVFARRLRHAAHAIVGLLPHHVAREARRDPLL
jgi:multidrug efflux pump subunit AcrB